MSDHPHTTAETPPNPFSPSELKQFGNDDALAGKAIGTMLSGFFFYTVVVMAASTVATYIWVTQ
jgi:hypothetical protein